MSLLPDTSTSWITYESRIVVGGKYRVYVTIYDYKNADFPMVSVRAVKRIKKRRKKRK